MTLLSADSDVDLKSLLGNVKNEAPKRSRHLTWLLAALPVTIILFEGWGRRWVADDAYIDFRVISNLTSGHGPVYNRGERLEVYTDPLWVGILSVFHWFSFLPIEWWAVLLGLGFTAAGVALGGWSGQALSRVVDGCSDTGAAPTVLPAGMLMFVSLDAAWDFSTSGLETGLIFGWLGASFAGLVRIACGGSHTRRSLHLTAALIGIGPLIRPDMALFSAPLLLALGAIATLSLEFWPSVRRSLPLLLSAFALPVLYELWRMAYFAMLVPNTALVKSAGSSWWGQGLIYLKDTVDPYLLWFPLAIAVAVITRRLSLLNSFYGGRLALLVAAPVVGAILDGVYVVRIGGDFMHGRMLLPAIFAIGLSFWVPLRSCREIAAGALVAGWSVLAISALHYPQRATFPQGIANERAFYASQSGNSHPVTLEEYASGDFARYGEAVGKVATGSIPPSSSVLLLESDQGDVSSSVLVPRSMPARVLAPLANIGIAGVVAGPTVYVYDELSLANPVGSHLLEAARGRPGHSQLASVVWMQGRFLPAQDDYLVQGASAISSVPNKQTPVEAARTALSCGELHRYLSAVDGRLTVGRMMSDIAHSFAFTTFRVPSNPYQAERRECGSAGSRR